MIAGVMMITKSTRRKNKIIGTGRRSNRPRGDRRLVLAGEKSWDERAEDGRGLRIDFCYFRRKMQQDVALGQNHGRESQSDAIILEDGTACATHRSRSRRGRAGWRVRDRYFATDGKLRALTRHGGNRRLGEDVRNPIALEDLQGRAQGIGWILCRQRGRRPVRRDRDRAIKRERIILGERAPIGGQRACGDAELLGDIAADFRDGDLQHHLIAATYGERIDDQAIRAHPGAPGAPPP